MLTLGVLIGAASAAFAADDPPPAAAGVGNPLWSITPDVLAATRDRPLFSPTRRPSPPVVVAPAQEPVAVSAVDAKAEEPERPPFTLLGTIVGSGARVALLQDDVRRVVVILREGGVASGWRARKVAARSVIISKGAVSVALDIPKPGEVAIAPRSLDNDAELQSLTPLAAASTEPTPSPIEGPHILPRFRH